MSGSLKYLVPGFLGVALTVLLAEWSLGGAAGKSEECPFEKSLHYTGEGMRYWYETEGGFMDITKIPYKSDQLDCKTCHANSCGVCHTKKAGDQCSYSVEKSKEKDTCLPCHKREGAALKIGKETGKPDVHFEKGMGCVDCHPAEEIHGDGTFHRSMRDPGVLKASCRQCHPARKDDIRPHTIHKNKVDCNSCHVSSSVVCLNCHQNSVIKDQNRAGNYIPPAQSWTLLVNYEGKVTSGTVQSLVYDDKKFIAYAPFFTHAVQKRGKSCPECHANPAVQMIKKGQAVPMAEFKDNQVVFWQGVVPLVPDKLKWMFLNKKEKIWVPIPDAEKVTTQFVCGGTPLTEDQVKKLATPFKN